MLRSNENPPMLFPEEITLDDFSGNWLVAHTKSRNEKALAHDLMDRQVQYFLPMIWNISSKSPRAKRSLLPLFSGYVFFCGNEDIRSDVLKTHRVANIINIADQDVFISELSQIEKALRSGEPLVPHRYIEKGQWCRVIAGPLMGLEGFVERMHNQTRLVLQIDILGQSASMEVDIDMVEQIEKPQHIIS